MSIGEAEGLYRAHLEKDDDERDWRDSPSVSISRKVKDRGLTSHSSHSAEHRRRSDHSIETGRDTAHRDVRGTRREYPGMWICSVQPLAIR